MMVLFRADIVIIEPGESVRLEPRVEEGGDIKLVALSAGQFLEPTTFKIRLEIASRRLDGGKGVARRLAATVVLATSTRSR